MLVSSQGPVLLLLLPSRDTLITVTHAHHPLPCLTPSWPSSPAQAGSLAPWSACFGLLFLKLSRTSQLTQGTYQSQRGPGSSVIKSCPGSSPSEAGSRAGLDSLLLHQTTGSPSIHWTPAHLDSCGQVQSSRPFPAPCHT